jgi:PadR family transcriptional regulator PadR
VSGSDVRGLLAPFLLLLICERPGHGYDLIERLVKLGAGDTEPGQVYRALRSLERAGHVASAWVASEAGPARRRYELTTGGMAELQAWMGRLAEVRQVLETCLSRWAEVCRDVGGQGLPVSCDATAVPDDNGWEGVSWARTRR